MTEKIVPDIELCKKLNPEEFKDCVFGWYKHWNGSYIVLSESMIDTYSILDIDDWASFICPAPLSEEILAKIPDRKGDFRLCIIRVDGLYSVFYGVPPYEQDTKLSNALLKVYLKEGKG